MIEEYTPKKILTLFKDDSNLYGFIFGDGDTWAIKQLPLDSDDVLKQLDSNHNKASYYIASITYKTPLGKDAVIVFRSIMFPDGRVWDVNIHNFRYEFGNKQTTVNFG